MLDDQVNDLSARIRRLAEKESPAPRADTLARLSRVLDGHPEAPAAPHTPRERAPQLLQELEHGAETIQGYNELAAMVRTYDLSTGTDNPSVRTRLALADLSRLMRADFDLVLPALRPLRGRPVVVSLWATWCAPCQAEMPLFEKLHREGVAILAVTDEDPAVVEAFMKQHGYTVPVVIDRDRRAFQRFGDPAMPALRLLDANGRLRAEASELDEGELRGLLRSVEIKQRDR